MTHASVEAEHCPARCPRPNSWDLRTSYLLWQKGLAGAMKASAVVAALDYPMAQCNTLVRGTQEDKSEVEVLRFAGFEDGGREPEPRNAGGF